MDLNDIFGISGDNTVTIVVRSTSRRRMIRTCVCANCRWSFTTDSLTDICTCRECEQCGREIDLDKPRVCECFA